MLFNYKLINYFILSIFLLFVSMKDFKTHVITNKSVEIGMILAILLNLPLYFSNIAILWTSLLGFLVGGSVILLISILTRGSIGGGDIKIFSVLGLWLGYPLVIRILCISFILGGIVASILLVLKIKAKGDRIAFGPFIFIATLITMVPLG